MILFVDWLDWTGNIMEVKTIHYHLAYYVNGMIKHTRHTQTPNGCVYI